MKTGRLDRLLLAVFSLLLLLFCLAPLYWALVTSLESGAALYDISPLPSHPSLDNYRQVFAEQPFARYIFNSLVVAGGTVLVATLAALPAAYALARFEVRGRRALLFAVLGVSMFPQVAVLSGLFALLTALGLYNSLAGLALTYMIFVLPFMIWLLMVFMRELPQELLEAARLDGAGELRILFDILVPLLQPALVASGLIAFIAAWNEFLFALTFTLTDKARTVPVAITFLSGASEHELPWPEIMAASLTVTLPVALLALLFQRRIVAGLTSGAMTS